MTLRELIHFVMDRGISTKTIGYIHETDSRWKDKPIEGVFNSYTNVLREMIELNGGVELDGYSLIIESNSQDGEEFTDVYLSNGEDKWSTSFVDWNELIDLPVVDQIGLETWIVLAHVLYDITFYGFTRKSVMDSAEELHETTKEDTIFFDLSSFINDMNEVDTE